MKLKLYFSKPKKLKIASRIIMWRLKTNYSHVAIEVPTGPIGLKDIYEASHGTVHGIWAEHWKAENQIVDEITIDIDMKQFFEVVRYLKKQRQKKYGLWTAIAATFPFIKKHLIDDGDDNRFICSELIAKALENVLDFSSVNLDYITPDKLRELL